MGGTLSTIYPVSPWVLLLAVILGVLWAVRELRRSSGRSPSRYSPRRVERVPSIMPVTLRIISGGEVVKRIASTVDVSQHGFRIRTTMALRPGQTLDIFPPRDKPSALVGRVVWVRAAASAQTTEAGIEFLDVAPAAA